MTPVAVTQRVEAYPDLHESRDALDQRLIVFLLAAGFIPVPIPNIMCDTRLGGETPDDALSAWLEMISPRAIVLSGGNDLGDCPNRDSTERRLLDFAQQRKLPALGICRGMQIMGVWAGATLKPVEGHVRARHRIAGGINGDVNSYHKYAIADCPLGFEVTARSEDGEIESIRHRNQSWEGWMWHPERENSFSARDIASVKNLFSSPNK